jgi:hypothetical protein
MITCEAGFNQFSSILIIEGKTEMQTHRARRVNERYEGKTGNHGIKNFDVSSGSSSPSIV